MTVTFTDSVILALVTFTEMLCVTLVYGMSLNFLLYQ